MSQLPELDHTATCACESGLMCADIRPGHGLHALQLRLAAATPSRWRDALVVTLDGSVVSLWNHGDLTDSVTPGEPIALHTMYNVLAAGSRRFNVLASAA